MSRNAYKWLRWKNDKELSSISLLKSKLNNLARYVMITIPKQLNTLLPAVRIPSIKMKQKSF